MTKTALVTGATGFVGSNLIRRLVLESWCVHILIRPESSMTLIHGVCEQITLHTHDGTTTNMLKIMTEVKPDLVFHLASLFIATHQTHDIESLINSNLLLGTQLLEAMDKGNVRYMVNVGTSWQHFENHNYDPVNLYAATKQALQVILRFYTCSTPLKVITLKLYDTYGAYDPRAKLFSLLQKISANEQPLAMSPGEQLIDIVYIDDVLDAFMLAADRLLEDKVNDVEDFAVSSGHPLKLKEVVKIYAKITGKVFPIIWGGRKYRDREVMQPWNTGKLLPGWKAKVSLKDGINRVIQIEGGE